MLYNIYFIGHFFSNSLEIRIDVACHIDTFVDVSFYELRIKKRNLNQARFFNFLRQIRKYKSNEEYLRTK